MAEIISLFNHVDFDFPYAECVECGGSEWKILLSRNGDLGIIGFQCLNCAIVGMFDNNEDIITFEIDETGHKLDK